MNWTNSLINVPYYCLDRLIGGVTGCMRIVAKKEVNGLCQLSLNTLGMFPMYIKR